MERRRKKPRFHFPTFLQLFSLYIQSVLFSGVQDFLCPKWNSYFMRQQLFLRSILTQFPNQLELGALSHYALSFSYSPLFWHICYKTVQLLLRLTPPTTYWVCLIVNCPQKTARAIYSLSIPIYIIRVRLAFFCHYPLSFYLPFFRFFPSTGIIMMCRQQNRWRPLTSLKLTSLSNLQYDISYQKTFHTHHSSAMPNFSALMFN